MLKPYGLMLWVALPASVLLGQESYQEDDVIAGLNSLKVAASSLSGSIVKRRVEEYRDDVFRSEQGVDELPITLEAQAWVRGSIFRADYVSYGKPGSAVVTQSVGLTDSKSFQFTPTLSDPHTGILSIWDSRTPDDPRSFAAINFLYPINSLWSHNGVPIADLLQRPDTIATSRPYHSLAKAFCIESHLESTATTLFVLDPDKNFACKFVEWTVVTNENKLSRVVRIDSTVLSGGVIVPRRYVEVSKLNDRAYTTVTVLNMAVDENAQLSGGLDAESFHDLKRDYPIIKYDRRGGASEVGYEFAADRVGDVVGDSEMSYRLATLLVIGIVAIVFVIAIKRYHRVSN